MHFNYANSLVVAALVASIFLVLNFGDRLFPLIALVATGLEALQAFHLVTIGAAIRLEVILPAAMLIAGAICWSRSSDKTNTTSSTILTIVGTVQLLNELGILR